jgi:hypothetical protein
MAQYWGAPITSTNFKIFRKIDALPVMAIIRAHDIDAHSDTESEMGERVHLIAENVSEDILMLLQLSMGPTDTLEAW